MYTANVHIKCNYIVTCDSLKCICKICELDEKITHLDNYYWLILNSHYSVILPSKATIIRYLSRTIVPGYTHVDFSWVPVQITKYQEFKSSKKY